MSAAPGAPGALGQRLEPLAVQEYLGELDTWVRERRVELDEIDAAARESTRAQELTGDILLSMALWKAVADRQRMLLTTWDGGRVGPAERERLSVLIHGRLDATFDPALLQRSSSAASNLAVSLPEACRLSDALAGQLRERLALDPAADVNSRVLKQVRATIERLRDQAALEPDAARAAVLATVQGLAVRAQDLLERLTRGGDIGGLVGPLENEAARLERDLIVGGAQRRDAHDQFVTVQQLRVDLLARGETLQRLADQVVQQVSPAPRQAVPDVNALGEVPATVPELTTYRARLERVAAAMDIAQEAYTQAQASLSDLFAQLAASKVRAGAAGAYLDPDLTRVEELAQEVLERAPCPLAVATRLVQAHLAWVEWRLTSAAPGAATREIA